MNQSGGTTVLRDAVTLAVILGVAFTLSAAVRAGTGPGGLTMQIGLVLLGAGVAGSLAAKTGLPRLTGYLLVGMMVGPSALGFVDARALEELRLIDSFALALIGLLAGGELRLRRLRATGRAIVTTTVLVTVVVGLGITVLVVLMRPILPFEDLTAAAVVGMAALLGIWAANSSPDLTVAVMEDVGSHGPLGDVILGVTIVKDMVVIVLFTVALAFVEPLLVEGGGGEESVLLAVVWEVGGSLMVGAVMGWVFSRFLEAPWKPRSPLGTFVFGFTMIVVAEALHLELLLLAASAGFLIENLSPAGDRLMRDIRSLAVVIFAFFFAFAGASLDLTVVRVYWLPGAIFFLVRLVLTVVGSRLGTALAGAGEGIRRNTGRGLISQGGVSLGLLLLIEPIPGVGKSIVGFGMAVILGNILLGPILLRGALTDADGASSPRLSVERVAS
jgi:Kef-type K+ transport system membrane component KefB